MPFSILINDFFLDDLDLDFLDEPDFAFLLIFFAIKEKPERHIINISRKFFRVRTFGPHTGKIKGINKRPDYLFGMPSIRIKKFNLKDTLDSGQLFRYWPHEDGYLIGQRGSLFFVRQERDKIEFEGCKRGYLTEFLGLNDPIEETLKDLREHTHIIKAAKAYPGIRLLNQDPWECLIGFICSSASNIPKIKRNMDGMSKLFGRQLRARGAERHSFPDPGGINDLEKIKSTGTGFRAKFIHGANKMVTDDWLSSLKKKPYFDAKKDLMTIPGVGSKISDCILLFSLGFREPFPVDVWIQRAMNEMYPQTKGMGPKNIEVFGRGLFGKNAGYAQQYIYHWRRNQKEEPTTPSLTGHAHRRNIYIIA